MAVDQAFADKHTLLAKKQVETAQQFRKARLDTVRKIEDSYFGRMKAALKERMAVPLPVMEGYVHTLQAKLDDPPRIEFNSRENLRAAQKISAAYEKETSPTRDKWQLKDLAIKFLAILSGRGIAKYYAESDPEYRSVLEVVDYNDFLCEPNGGGDLDNHLFKGQERIFKTKQQLEAGATKGFYNKAQVQKLINGVGENDFKQTESAVEDYNNRQRALGLDPKSHNFVGVATFSMIEWEMVSPEDGKKYYILFDSKSGTWVRFVPLEEVAKAKKLWLSWATHYDPFNFWSKGPCDSILPVAEAMNIIFNQFLENRQRKNFTMRAYDPEVFPDPSKLKFRPDGLVRATPQPGKTVQNSIYSFDVDGIEGNIDLLAFLDSFIGQKSGITAGAMGASEKDKKVGIFFGELQQVEDRLGLKNKYYSQFYAELGKLFEYGAWEHMSEKYAVKFIGTEGAEWDVIRKEDHDPEFEIQVLGGSAERESSAAKAKIRLDIASRVEGNQVLFSQTNKRAFQEFLMRTGDAFSEEEIQAWLDVDNYGSQENLSRASKAIQQILEGKKPKLYRGATTGFIQRIINFAIDKELDLDIYKAMMIYAESHIDIVIENMRRRSITLKVRQRESAMLGPMPGGAVPAAENTSAAAAGASEMPVM